MLFVSVIFLLFFILFYFVYWNIRNQNIKEYFILAGSLVFYASWSIYFLFHLLFIVTINYLILCQIKKNFSKKYFLVGLILNITNLFFFKYFYFFLDNFYLLTHLSIFNRESLNLKIILPLAISFYTFQLIAFLVDTYEKKISELPKFSQYLVFILFFPQLIAGPIMRYKDFFPQLGKITLKKSYLYVGIFLILIGVIKKALLADNISKLISPVWSYPQNYDWSSLVLAAYGFSLQVYCDFSGYSDIARGCAFLLGLKIPINFKAPFFATSISELWRKWHITLNSWLRDYIFIPLGGSRVSENRVYVNLIFTFALGGFWHGSKWTFIFWGIFFGICLSMERWFKKANFQFLFSSSILRIFIVFSFFSFGMFFFRANSILDTLLILRKIFTFENSPLTLSFSLIAPYFVFCFALQHLEKIEQIPKFFFRWKNTILFFSSFIIFIFIGLYAGSGKEFIYFQF